MQSYNHRLVTGTASLPFRMENSWPCRRVFLFLFASVFLLTLVLIILRLPGWSETSYHHVPDDEIFMKLSHALKSSEHSLLEGLTNWEYRLINQDMTNGYDTSVFQRLSQTLADLGENLTLARIRNGESMLMERRSVGIIDKILVDFEQHIGKLRTLDSLLMIKLRRKYSQAGMENALPWLRATSLPAGKTWRSLLTHMPRGLNMVFFNNYNAVTLRQTLASVTNSVAYSFLDRFHQCLFVLGRSGHTGRKEAVRNTVEIINHVRFCKKTVWRLDVENINVTDSFSTWRAVLDRIYGKYNSQGDDNLKAIFRNDEADVLFLDEDVVLSEDALDVALFASLVKNTLSGIWQFALIGEHGANTVNAHPDTFVVRKAGIFLRKAYGLNRSTWNLISEQLDTKSFERETEWNANLGKMIVKYNQMRAFHVVVPTLARAHVIIKNEKIPWSLATRSIDMNIPTVNKGIRDVYGFLCDPRVLVPVGAAEEAECACSSRKWSLKLSRNMYCYEQPFHVRDKCVSEKYIELH